MNERRKTLTINIGDVPVGGDAPISVQSMTNTDTRNVNETLDQIKRLKDAGCEIVRLAVPDMEAVQALQEIKSRSAIPVIADVHYNYRLAIACLEQGIDGLRINPGNIGGKQRFLEVIMEAKKRDTPIRIGVNAGSLEKKIQQKYNGITPSALVDSALGYVGWAEEVGFRNLKLSIKASRVPLMVEAYRLLASQVDYPLHLGVTEAGPLIQGTVKSSVGIGILLAEGIGDTIRVSLTGDPVQEVKVGFEILKALQIRNKGVEIISCPTCGRCQVDLAKLVAEVEQKLRSIDKPLKIAVMGCSVNGPGEARHADAGIAGGKNSGVVFSKGKVIARVSEEEIVSILLNEVEKLVQEENGIQ